MALRGERDPDRLSDDALAYLVQALPRMADSGPAVVANRAAIETELRQLGASRAFSGKVGSGLP
jgi:hypothetical protein